MYSLQEKAAFRRQLQDRVRRVLIRGRCGCVGNTSEGQGLSLVFREGFPRVVGVGWGWISKLKPLPTHLIKSLVVQSLIHICRLKMRFFLPKRLPTVSRNISLESESSFYLFRENCSIISSGLLASALHSSCLSMDTCSRRRLC